MSHILAAGAARMKLEAGNYEARIAALEAQLDELAAENERLKRLNNGLHDEVQFMRKAAKEARETLASTGAVNVKPLEWTKLSTGWISHTSFHAYEVVATANGFMATYANLDFAWGEEETMKLAAQTDYERRILYALEATPPAPKVTEAQAELIRRVVMPMVGERSREVGDAWDKAYHVLDALTAAQEAGKP